MALMIYVSDVRQTFFSCSRTYPGALDLILYSSYLLECNWLALGIEHVRAILAPRGVFLRTLRRSCVSLVLIYGAWQTVTCGREMVGEECTERGSKIAASAYQFPDLSDRGIWKKIRQNWANRKRRQRFSLWERLAHSVRRRKKNGGFRKSSVSYIQDPRCVR